MLSSQNALFSMSKGSLSDGSNCELEILEKWNGILVASLKKVSLT